MSSNLPRVHQKIFGETAADTTPKRIAQFGSVIAGDPKFTGDIEEIQALQNWEQGWVGATITDRRYPTSEETTGINKVVTQQLAYLFQKGIPEWCADVTYYANTGFCQHNGHVWQSLTDNNINNEPGVSVGYWQEFSGSGSTSISMPATNYIESMSGSVTRNDRTITFPNMTLCAPNGIGSNGMLQSTTLSVVGRSYTVSNGNGDYTLLYNNDTNNLYLASTYNTRLSSFPASPAYGDVCYLLNNKMYISESVPPNYTLSGATVNAAGVVSNLGALLCNDVGTIPTALSTNIKFTTGADVTTTQDLGSTPCATYTIANGVLTTSVYSYSYGVSYYPRLYSGSYSLDSQIVSHAYQLSGTTYYANETLDVGVDLYTNVERTILFGEVTSLTESLVTVNDGDTDVYIGPYEDVSTTTYRYLIGGSYIYTSAPLAANLLVYSDAALTTIYGSVESISSSTVVIHEVATTIGYVAVESEGHVLSGIPIYTDADLQNIAQISTGVDATYLGNSSKSLVGTLTYNVSTSTTYQTTLTFTGSAYALDIDGTTVTLPSTRVPYQDTPSFVLGGTRGFLGTVDLPNTNITDAWQWNGKSAATQEWVERTLCKLGTITIANNTISQLTIDTPMELVKMSDIASLINSLDADVKVKEFYRNGENYYIIFNNGFCIQGGIIGAGLTTRSLLVATRDVNYIILIAGCQDGNYRNHNYGVWNGNRQTTYFQYWAELTSWWIVLCMVNV